MKKTFYKYPEEKKQVHNKHRKKDENNVGFFA